MTLIPVDPTNEASVVTLLERAAQWLSEAVHRGEPGDIAMVKAQMATAAEATKQLGLSKEIQLDAQEMVRRAEYALSKAIRRGQAEGTVQTVADGHVVRDLGPIETKTPVRALLPSGSDRARHADLVDVDPSDFDAAIDAAKAEGNLSRANVARKAQAATPGAPRRTPITDDARNAGLDLKKVTDRLERLAADDRLGKSKGDVAAHLRHHVARAIEVLTDLDNRINN